MTGHRRQLDRGSTLAAARAFYCDALGGRQMRRMTSGDGTSKLKFLVGEDLVTTGPGAADDRVTLVVDDAVAVAERCWDAGFEVRVRGPADAGTIVVIDPFDLELEVVSSGSHLGTQSHHDAILEDAAEHLPIRERRRIAKHRAPLDSR